MTETAAPIFASPFLFEPGSHGLRLKLSFRWIVPLLAIILTAGCSALKSREEGREAGWLAPGQSFLVSEAESLLLYHEHLRKLSIADLNREHEGVKRTLARSNSDFSRMRLAMLLSLSGANFRDDGRALGLLEPMLAAGAADNETRALAQLLYVLISERRRIEERLKDEQRKTEGLQQKLDALKSIEKSLLEREPAKLRNP